jgi:ketosteroid isomerase-like protein
MALHRRPDFDVAQKFDPIAALKKYHAAIEARDFKSIAAMLIEDAVYQSKGLGSVKGRAAIVATMESYFKDHPDHQAWDTAVSAKSNYIARSEWQLRATNSKTKTTISRHGTELVFFDTDGKIVTVEVEDLT